MSDEQEFQVLDPVEVGDLSDVSERPLIPPTRNVKLQIKRVQPLSNDEGWKGLGVAGQLVDGVMIDGKPKFKGMYVNLPVITYAEAPDKSDRQHLGKLASLQRATGLAGHRIDDEFIQLLKDKIILCDILQGKNRNSGEPENTAQNYKVLPPEMSV